MKKFSGINVDEYIEMFPPEIRVTLEEMRRTIKRAAPNAEETISYQMPAYRQNGILVYFAGCKTHIGFYPTSSGVAAFQDELVDYKSSKGAIQIPLDRELPVDLISRIVHFRAAEDIKKKKAKK